VHPYERQTQHETRESFSWELARGNPNARPGHFEAFAPTRGPVLVLADRTDVPNGKLLVFALPRNGRSVPFWVRVVPKGASDGTVGDDEAIEGRLITAYDPEAKEPWYLVTDLSDMEAQEIVSIYRRRWWIETLIRDGKNRDWGLGLAMVITLKDYRRYERLFYIVALGFIFLCAHGALAKAEGFD